MLTQDEKKIQSEIKYYTRWGQKFLDKEENWKDKLLEVKTNPNSSFFYVSSKEQLNNIARNVCNTAFLHGLISKPNFDDTAEVLENLEVIREVLTKNKRAKECEGLAETCSVIGYVDSMIDTYRTMVKNDQTQYIRYRTFKEGILTNDIRIFVALMLDVYSADFFVSEDDIEEIETDKVGICEDCNEIHKLYPRNSVSSGNTHTVCIECQSKDQESRNDGITDCGNGQYVLGN